MIDILVTFRNKQTYATEAVSEAAVDGLIAEIRKYSVFTQLSARERIWHPYHSIDSIRFTIKEPTSEKGRGGGTMTAKTWIITQHRITRKWFVSLPYGGATKPIGPFDSRQEAVDAAESLPARPEQFSHSLHGFDIEGIGKASCDICDAPAHWSSTKGSFRCDTHAYPEPVAPVEAKEKEPTPSTPASADDLLEATERLIERYQEALTEPATTEIESKALHLNMKTLQKLAKRFAKPQPDSSSITNEMPKPVEIVRDEIEAWLAAVASGAKKQLKDRPTFAYELAMFLTRNSQTAYSPQVQADIEQFLSGNGWKALRG